MLERQREGTNLGRPQNGRGRGNWEPEGGEKKGCGSWEENIGYRIESREGFLKSFCLVPVSNNSSFIFSMLSLTHIFQGSMCSFLLIHSPPYSFLFLYPIQSTSFHLPDHPGFSLPFPVLCIMILCAQTYDCALPLHCVSSLTTYAWQLFIIMLHEFYFKMLKKSLRSQQAW